MSSLQLGTLEAKIARARQLVIEQQRLVRTRRVDDVAKARELLHDLTYWLHNLEAHREILLRQSGSIAPRARVNGMTTALALTQRRMRQ